MSVKLPPHLGACGGHTTYSWNCVWACQQQEVCRHTSFLTAPNVMWYHQVLQRQQHEHQLCSTQHAKPQGVLLRLCVNQCDYRLHSIYGQVANCLGNILVVVYTYIHRWLGAVGIPLWSIQREPLVLADMSVYDYTFCLSVLFCC